MCKRAGIELDDFEALFGENSGGINEMMPSTKKRDKSQYPIRSMVRLLSLVHIKLKRNKNLR